MPNQSPVDKDLQLAPRRLVDLGASITSPVGRTVYRLLEQPIERFLSLDALNRLYSGMSPVVGDRSYFATALRGLGVNYDLTPEDVAKIPVSGPLVIVASSGMCEGGRVLHHLAHGVSDPDNIVLLAGYQAENTLGRKLNEGVSPVNILGRPYVVRAQIAAHQDCVAGRDARRQNRRALDQVQNREDGVPAEQAGRTVGGNAVSGGC